MSDLATPYQPIPPGDTSKLYLITSQQLHEFGKEHEEHMLNEVLGELCPGCRTHVIDEFAEGES